MAKSWEEQKTLSVRVPKGTDREILEWLADLRERKQLQSTVMEALHRMYYDHRGINTVVVPVQPGDRMDRNFLKNLVRAEQNPAQHEKHATQVQCDSNPATTFVTESEVVETSQDQMNESSSETNEDNAALIAALIFDAVRDDF